MKSINFNRTSIVKALDANMCTLDPSGRPLLYSFRLSCAEAIVRAAKMRTPESPDIMEEFVAVK
jgi:hypothetical protein